MIEIYHYNPLIIYDINMSDLFVTFFFIDKKKEKLSISENIIY